MTVRLVAAVAALVSAAVHLRLWFDGYDHLDVVGPLFLLNAVAGVVIAALLLLWRHWVPLFLVFGFGVATLGGFVIASTVGLFGVHEQWAGFYVWAAVVAEAVAIVTGPVSAWLEGHLSREQSQHRLAGSGPDLH